MHERYENLRMFFYFWREKGDPSYMTDWEEVKEALRKRYPELIAAWERYDLAHRTLDRICEAIEHEI